MYTEFINLHRVPMHFPRLLRAILQPHYVYRPSQLLRRVLREWTSSTSTFETATLPWGTSLYVDPTKHIGRSVWLHGIYDTAVCEILWRLSEPGVTAVDVGANIGVMTSLLAHRAHPHGTIYSFEPQPMLYTSLTRNIDRFSPLYDTDITPRPFALHNQSGLLGLGWDHRFEDNQGTAPVSTHSNRIQVSCTTLDDFFLLPILTLSNLT